MRQIVFKTICVLALAMMSLQANAQVKEFEKYADTKNVTYVFISKYMLAMTGKSTPPSVPGIDTKTLAGKLTGIQIITSENETAQKKLKNDVKTIMTKDKYELLMQMNEDDNKVNIYYLVDRQQSAVVMLVEDGDEVTVMVFSGKFTLEDVMKMTQ